MQYTLLWEPSSVFHPIISHHLPAVRGATYVYYPAPQARFEPSQAAKSRSSDCPNLAHPRARRAAAAHTERGVGAPTCFRAPHTITPLIRPAPPPPLILPQTLRRGSISRSATHLGPLHIRSVGILALRSLFFSPETFPSAGPGHALCREAIYDDPPTAHHRMFIQLYSEYTRSPA